MAFNHLRLNPLKCEVVGRKADGTPLAQADLALHGVSIDGHLPQPCAHDHPIRYLGLHVSFDGSWAVQRKKALGLVSMFTRLVSKFALPLRSAAYMFNVFLLPKLELALAYVHGPGCSSWLKDCDRLLIGSVKHAAGSLLSLSHSAVALSLGLVLPSWLEASVKVSELFLRMNSSDPRWGRLGRVAFRQQCGSSVTAATLLPPLDSGTRLTRAARLAAQVLQWELHLDVQSRRASSRRRHLYHCEPLLHAPAASECSLAQLLQLKHERSIVAFDAWAGWGASLAPLRQTVSVFTDGSFDRGSDTSAWSVAVCDEWLEDNYGTLPDDEQLLSTAHVGGAALFGASIACTGGVYPAELQAIARALVMFPLTTSLHIYTDSRASIAAMASYAQQLNERKRLRMAARPLLQFIHHQLRLREQIANGGSVQFSHVRAHTNNADLVSVGNRLADYQANLCRSKPDRVQSTRLHQLPVELLELHLSVREQGAQGRCVIDDIRRAALKVLKSEALIKWATRPEQGLLAGESMLALADTVRRLGTPAQQTALMHIATNSIQYHLIEEADGSQSLQQLPCSRCLVPLTLSHLVQCSDSQSDAATLRKQLKDSLVDSLERSLADSALIPASARANPSSLLRWVFPPAPSLSTEQLQRHAILCMVGAFCSSQLRPSLRSLSRAPAPGRTSTLQQFRLLCVQHLLEAFATWKERF